MKTLKTLLFPAIMLTVLVVPAFAQTNAPIALPDQLLNTPLRDWQLNGVTLLLLIQVLGRAYTALSNGGGLKGIISGIVNETNTKTPITKE